MASGTLPQLNVADFEPQIIWLLIIFAVFYTIIKIKLVPYFYSETENREQYIHNNHQDARKLQKKAERLADEYNEKIQAVHLRANDLILEAKQKVSRHLEGEKNRLNNEMAIKLNTHYVSLQQSVNQVEQEMTSYLDDLNKRAQQKTFAISFTENHNNLQLKATIIGDTL